MRINGRIIWEGGGEVNVSEIKNLRTVASRLAERGDFGLLLGNCNDPMKLTCQHLFALEEFMIQEAEYRKVVIPCGDLTLEGILLVPPTPASIGAVVCHPHPLNGGNMKNYAVAKVATKLAEEGIAALRFNFRGTGRSTGVHDYGVGEIDDVLAAISFLLKELPLDKVDIVGYSFGSRVGMLAGANDERVRKLVGIAPPVTSMDMSGAGNSPKEKLFVKGTIDQHASEEDFAAWCAPLPEPKEICEISGADHFFMGREMEIAQAVAEFLKKGIK